MNRKQAAKKILDKLHSHYTYDFRITAERLATMTDLEFIRWVDKYIELIERSNAFKYAYMMMSRHPMPKFVCAMLYIGRVPIKYHTLRGGGIAVLVQYWTKEYQVMFVNEKDFARIDNGYYGLTWKDALRKYREIIEAMGNE